MPCNKQERPATKKNESQRAATTSNALIWIQMTTDAPGDMIRMQNPNQAKRCLPEMAGAAIFIPERRIPSRTLLSFACGITAAPASGVSWKQIPNRRIIKPSAKTCCSSTRSGTPSPRTPYPTSTTGEACS
nr:MAG TPA: hypothetical protein [Caudoviricetes sp.]